MTLADPVLVQTAQVVSVFEVQAGTSLVAAVTAGATVLSVEDVDDFSDEGGSLIVAALEDADSTTEAIPYASVDRDLATITLAAPWNPELVLYAVGDQVWVAPFATERRAEVMLDGEEDQLVVARIPYGLSTAIPLGVRRDHSGEWVRVAVDEYGYSIVDAVGEYGVTDPESVAIIDPDTGESIGEIGSDAAFDTITADEVISPSVPRRNETPWLLYVDPVNGSDDNDGTAFPPVIDSFDRVTSNSLGTADSGQVWSNIQNQGNLLDCNGSNARIRLNGGDQNTIVRVAFSPMDAELVTTINLSGLPGAGSSLYGVLARGLAGTDLLAAQLEITSTGLVRATIGTKIDGTWANVLQVQVESGLTAGAIAGIDWNLRAQFQTNADGGTDVRLKIWRSTNVEPDAWTVEANVTTGILQTIERVGIVGRAGSAYTGTVIAAFRSLTANVIDAGGLPIDVSEGGVGPLASIAAALVPIGEWNDADCRLILTGTFDESIVLAGLAGGGRLFLDGGNTTTLFGIVKLYGVTSYVELRNMTIQDTGDAGVGGTVEVRTSRHVEIVNVKFQSNGARSYNVNVIEGADARVEGCQLSGATAFCVQAAEESTAWLSDNSGSATSGSYRCAGAIIFLNGTKPSGATANNTGGQFFGSNTTSGGGTAPTPNPKVTKTYSPNASRTWRPEWGWREDDDETYQGEYQGSGGISRGCAFHGTKLNVAGKTADSGKVFIKRLNSGGASGKQGVYLASHDLASQPSSDSANPAVKDGPTKLGELAWGEGKWFDIPKAWVQSMLDGTGGRRGFMLYHASASPYVIAAGAKNGGDVWKVKFTFH